MCNEDRRATARTVFGACGYVHPAAIIAAFHCSAVVSTSSLGPANLAPHRLLLRADEQPEFPPQLMRKERSASRAAVLRDTEQIAQLFRLSVPVWPLEDVQGHANRTLPEAVASPSRGPRNWEHIRLVRWVLDRSKKGFRPMTGTP